MDSAKPTTKIFIFAVFILNSSLFSQPYLIPVSVPNRYIIDDIELTTIGAFGTPRLERPGIPAHLHTGIDIKRPNPNYIDEPIYPIAAGRIISVRHDGPFAQIIMEHHVPEIGHVWSAYEHVAGITCSPGDSVNSLTPIARFMNQPELDYYGYQFDHLHLEILRQPPQPVLPTPQLPHRMFRTYNLFCYTEKDLSYYYINPFHFFTQLANLSSYTAGQQ